MSLVGIGLVVGLFFVSAITYQTFAQDTLTIKEALEKTFGKENGELENQTREKVETGFTIEDLNPEEDLAKKFHSQPMSYDEIIEELCTFYNSNHEQKYFLT